MNMEQLTFLSEERPAKTLASQESEWDLLEKEAYSRSTLSGWLMSAVQSGLFGKMCPVYSPAQEGRILPNCYRYSPDGKLIRPKADGEASESSSSRPDVSGWRGGCLTCSMPEWTAFRERYRNAETVCSLSDILETGDVPRKYYLSQKACLGILRRAEKRGKELPAVLKEALLTASGRRLNSVAEKTRKLSSSTLSETEPSAD